MKYILIILLCITCSISIAQEDARGSKSTKTESSKEGTKRALVIGISDYISKDLTLNYADNDAYMFKDYLSQIEKVTDENISFLANEEATGMRISQELKNIYSNSNSGDIVYIYFAGHGDVIDDFGDKVGYLLAADANSHQEYNGVGGVLPLAYLNEKVIPKLTEKGVKVFLVLDACRSGFIYKEGTQKNMGAIQAMFENSIKFLSCGPNELSYESNELKHGYFTYYLVKALAGNADKNSDNNLQYNEIDDYLYNNVNNIVSKKHKQNQIPIVRTENTRAVYKAVTQNEKTIVFTDVSKDKINKEVKARGSIKAKNESPEIAKITKEFTEALNRKDYYGKSLSALEHIKAAKENKNIPTALITKMEAKLVDKLASNAQTLINDYIDGTKELPLASEFLKQAKNLEICLELMDEEDYLYSRIKASKLLLESYAVIKSKNYFGYAKAKSKLKEALNIEPKAAYIHNAIGLIYNLEQKTDSAHYHFNEAKNLIKTWSAPINNLSDNLVLQNRYEEAKQLIGVSLGMNGSDASTFAKLGEIYENEGKYHLAEEQYKKAIVINPENTYLLQKISTLYKNKGNVIESQKWFDKAIKSDSLSTIFNYGLLKYINEQNIDKKRAENMFIDAIEKNPHTSELYSQYGDFLSTNVFRTNRNKLADSLYTKAINKNPFNVSAYSGKAWLNFKMRKKEEAKASFEKGISSNPNNAEAYFNYANYLNEALKDYTTAKEYYLKAIEKNKLYIPAYTKLVELYNNQKQQDNSIKLLKEVLEKNNEVPDLWNLLGDSYFVSNKYTEAIVAYKKAIEIDNSYAKSYSKLGQSELETNQFEASKQNYLLANTYDPYQNKKSDIATYILSIARNKLQFGTTGEAKELFKLAYEIDESVEKGIPYAEHLYLHQEPQNAYTICLELLKKEVSKKEKITVYELAIKSAIDVNDKESCNKYMKSLVEEDPEKTYMLLMAVYCKFIGNTNCYNDAINKVNQKLLNSTKLREIFSDATIKNYIYNK
ncbi:tetratricopeptide repeat protein [uncultured Flavobacterium sp.]|uniref:tetratricopeptide repeat protein n=1 Tax=uncultured Flavobacterium sp. TaxID=165435 RepID=UPI0030C7F06E